MRVLITGANGFIGSYLVSEGVRRGYEVWVSVRSTSDMRRLQGGGKIRKLTDLPFWDAGKLAERLSAVPGGWDYVVHNAGVTKVTDKRDFMRINGEYTGNFVEALEAACCRPKKFLLMSSLSSLGEGGGRPESLYGRSKLAAEGYVEGCAFPWVILRPTGVYGPGDGDYALALRSVRCGLGFSIGCKAQKLTFIYVKDLARLAFVALESDRAVNRHYAVSDGDTYTDRAYTRLLQQAVGRRGVLRVRIPLALVRVACFCSECLGRLTNRPATLNTDKYLILRRRDWSCDTSAPGDELGFVAEYPLARGLAETAAGCQ
jgi:nucleoside-diphosphate-sugar epimerase